MMKRNIARIDANGRTQSLWEHGENVGIISASVSHFPNSSKLIAFLHDIGKLSDDFQNYITDGGARGSVIHAWQGAFLANEIFTDNSVPALLLKEIIAFCITAHHNNLSDGVSCDGTTDYLDNFLNTKDTKYSYYNIKAKIEEEYKKHILQLFNDAKEEIDVLIANISGSYQNRNSADFALGLLVKYLYSCLVDGDRLDAYLFSTNSEFTEENVVWYSLLNTFEENITKFPQTGVIDSIRKSISDKCKAAAIKETGIYQLSVPTGGGKTLSSLRFALHHCNKWGKKRIIYIIPYLSIIEQTANNIRKILNLTDDNSIVFEHHSNIIDQGDEKSAEIRAITAARYESPIIITTMVQFLETVMSAKASKLRKFAHMADSVLIFDEIQTMPIKAIHCFNEVISFLSNILKSTVILCSATQPTLESTQRANLLLAKNPKLIDCTDDFKDIKRVNVTIESEMNTSAAADFILDKANDTGNCLVIVNTKKSAFDIYNLLRNKNSGFEILHLSTSMCPNHRIVVISKMKNCLIERKRIICVSTQLIEAGVDISFSCVIRAMAGLDSIAQAAGRCNRNGESIEAKTVYTFSFKDENLDKLPDIKAGKETTLQISMGKTDNRDLLEESIMAKFYRKYFEGKDSQMDYPTDKNETIYAMLSSNRYGKQNYQNKTGIKFPNFLGQAFHSANMSFRVIENNTTSVVVLFDDAEVLIKQYQQVPANVITKEKIQIIKQLQKYSVGLYEWQIQTLSKQQALSLLDEETGILILDKNYYADDVGVVLEIIQDNLII